jgi:hypothetical protein
MSEQITVNSDDLDNAVFGVAQEIADKTPGLTVRNKMRLTLDISDQIMLAVNSITEAGRRSAAGKKAAEARYAKPKPGPAIPADTKLQMPAPAPAPQATFIAAAPAAPAPGTPVPGNFLQQPDLTIPPPPHPALAPGQTPFGAPPA